MRELQMGGPVHTWPDVELPAEGTDSWRSSFLTVGQVMQTDLFTVRPHDIISLAASVMDWRQIRYLPVETEDGVLVGLVSRRALVRLIAQGMERHGELPTVEQVMTTELVTVTPESPTVEAIRKMRDARIGCLLVVQDGSLAGMVTERDLINVSAKLLEDFLQEA
jgi:CBS domain-containing protein